jgi:hypothetical protein
VPRPLPAAPPEGDQANPNPIRCIAVLLPRRRQLSISGPSHLLSQQRALAQLLQPAAVQADAEAAQLLQEFLVAEVLSTRAQRPAAAFYQPAEPPSDSLSSSQIRSRVTHEIFISFCNLRGRGRVWQARFATMLRSWRPA